MRQSRRIRATVTMGAAAVALTATAGCGTQTARDTSKAVNHADTIASALARVTDQTNKIGSAQVAFTTDLGTGRPVTMTGTYSWGKGAAYDVMMDTAAA